MSLDSSLLAIIDNDVRSILAYGPKPMRNRAEWQQDDSNLLAHFLDVVSCISRSSWSRATIQVNLSWSENPAASIFGAQEQLVYVSLIFRQLLSSTDKLLKDAVTRHGRFSSSEIRRNWVKEKAKAAVSTWNSAPIVLYLAAQAPEAPPDCIGADGLPTGLPTVRELFDAFLYGAHVFHSRSIVRPANIENLRKLLETYPKHILLGSLHGGLSDVYNQLVGAARAIHQDYAKWFAEESLPAPEVYWQNLLLNPVAESKEKSDS